jgi:hypothetical protein
MTTFSALTLVQASVDDWPALIVDGVAVHPVRDGPAGTPVTETTTEEVSSFTLLRAVRV